MASLLPCKWPLNKISYSSPSPTTNSPPVFFTFRFSSLRRHRLTTLACYDSLDDSSSGSNARKSTNLHISPSEKRSSRIGIDAKNDIVFGSQKRRIPSLKALFGRKSLWKRIVFASTKVRSIILLNVITVVYASNIPVVKEVEAIMDPATFTVVRFAVSAIPFIPFVFQARGDVKTRNAGIELGFWVSLGYLTQALGLMTSDAGRASFISMFTVILVPLLDGMLGAVVPARTWFGALMSIIGVAMLEFSGSPPNIGDLLNFLSAVFFGIHMLRTEHISRSTNEKNFLPLLGYEVCVVACFSTLWYFIEGGFDGIQACDPSSWTWTMVWHWIVTFPWIPALYTGVFSTGLCLWIEMTAMCDVSATETAIIYGLEPVWGAAFAWFLLGERWGTAGWIGATLVLVGSLTVQIFGSSSPGGSVENEGKSEKVDRLLVPDKQNGFSTSPVPVSYRKDVTDMLKK
ncbi:uncharacterized protein LOC8258205 isoform X1 [Ricinus communis]|uniref:uncharacterized protein LOC8258205 isoform X1 n=1 Tax=Ricinus communis TaxID=3988 RepID=UPI00201A6B40|nr:uncharacterized protein LOC8258205 isoform X1 [Ricinus communis]